MAIVALSASYGALGSVIGPRVAEVLDVPFIDRAIPLGVAAALDLPVGEADADEQRPRGSLLERILVAFANAEPVTGPMPIAVATDEDEFQRATEEVLRDQVATGSGVMLGRGAVMALRDDPRVLRVRLDGPEQARVEQAMAVRGLSREEAERGLRASDKVHADYARRFYDADPRDSSLYHVMLDATALAPDTCVELIVMAARQLHPR